MMISETIRRWVLLLSLLLGLKSLASVSAICDLSVLHGNDLYNFYLTRPIAKHPHGILSEDGFYKIAVNETVLWFQLCDQMIFNHDQPRCFGCQGCGGETHCGMKCGALVSNNIGGYLVCETIGQASTANVFILDVMNPRKGINVKISAIGPESNCSLTVTIFCDPNGVQGPYSLDRLGICDYAAKMSHPSGCATIISGHGRGWGWFGTLIIIILCIFGVYLLTGTIYRFFFLGVRGIEFAVGPYLYMAGGVWLQTASTYVRIQLAFICGYYVLCTRGNMFSLMLQGGIGPLVFDGQGGNSSVIPNLDFWHVKGYRVYLNLC